MQGRIHRPRHHGRPDGGPSGQGRPSSCSCTTCAQLPQDLLDERRQACGSGARGGASRPRSIITDGARHAACRGGAVRRRRRRRGADAGQDRRRHELDLAARDQGVRAAHQRARLRLPRRAGVGRRSRRQGRLADHHGRRPRSGLREGQAAVRADGQEHHAGRRQRRRPDHQGRQPDHRRADHRGGRRGAAVRRRRPAPTRPRCARR